MIASKCKVEFSSSLQQLHIWSCCIALCIVPSNCLCISIVVVGAACTLTYTASLLQKQGYLC